MSCLACTRTLPLDMFDRSGTGRRRICQDCVQTGRATPALRQLARRVAGREYMRRIRYPWYARAA